MSYVRVINAINAITEEKKIPQRGFLQNGSWDFILNVSLKYISSNLETKQFCIVFVENAKARH